MRKYGFSVATIIAVVAIGGCARQQPNGAEIARAQIPGSVPNLLSLGQGYEKGRANYLVSKCVQGTVKDDAAQTGKVEFQRDMSFEDSMNLLNGGISVGVSFPTVKVSGSADYASKTSATEFRESYTIYIKNTKKTYFESGTQTITDDAKNLGEEDRTVVCGDEYVNEIDSAATFTASLVFEWGSQEDKLNFGGSLSVSVAGSSAVEVTGRLKYADEKVKNNLRIRLEVTQVGGDARDLSTVIDPALTSCNGNNISNCVAGFKKAIEYAQKFNSQLTGNDKYIPVMYHTEAYAETSRLREFFKKSPDFVTSEVEDMRETLESKLQVHRRYLERNDYVSRLSSSRSTAEQQALEANAENIRSNRSRLVNTLLFCYDKPFTVKNETSGNDEVPCILKGTETLSTLKPVNVSLFEVKPALSASERKCEDARKALLQRGVISGNDYELFRAMSWGPELAIPGDLSSGILGWTSCEDVADRLP